MSQAGTGTRAADREAAATEAALDVRPERGAIGFSRRSAIVIGLLILCLLAWRLREILLILFASVLLAILLTGLSCALERRFGFSHWLSVTLVLVGVALAVGGIAFFFGQRIAQEFQTALDLLPKAAGAAADWLKRYPLGRQLLADLEQSGLSPAISALKTVPHYALSLVNGGIDLFFVLAAAIYFTAQPGLYRRGVLRLWSPARRAAIRETMDEIGDRLKRWLLSRLIAMAAVGVMVGASMWWIGIPVPMALGLFAGLADFVPFFGPITSAVPAVLLALPLGFDKAVWTVLAFFAVQMIENHVLVPLLQQYMVHLPAVASLFVVVSFAVVFGILGAILATPVTIALIIIFNHSAHGARRGQSSAA